MKNLLTIFVIFVISIFVIIYVSWILLIFSILLILFLIFGKIRINKIIPKFDVDLMERIKQKINDPNVHTVQAYENGMITIGYYFNIGWDSGIQLIFEVKNDSLIFKEYGKFGFRDEKYNTEENKEKLNEFIKYVENIKI